MNFKIKFLLSLFLLTGFFVNAQTGVTVVDSIYSNGIYRTYRLYRPTIYTGATSVPLILNLHGYTSNSFQQQIYGNFMPIADTANFLVVHPQGTKDGSNQPYWNAGISTIGANDLLFLSQLIDSLKATYNIDNNCVYSTGMSNGGFMSNYLACNLSNKIAAIAGVTGTIFTNWFSSCNPGRPVPVMHIHGTADPTVPYAGNSSMIAADTLVKMWRVKNNCNSVPSFSNVPNINTTDGCTAEHYIYSGGNSGSTVEFYKIIGGGHTWPGAAFTTGVTNQDFNASVQIWRFFRKYKLNTLTSVNEIANSRNDVIVFPNPSSGFIQIVSDEKLNYELFDVSGKRISINEITANTIDISKLESGIYFLSLSNNSQKEIRKIVKVN